MIFVADGSYLEHEIGNQENNLILIQIHLWESLKYCWLKIICPGKKNWVQKEAESWVKKRWIRPRTEWKFACSTGELNWSCGNLIEQFDWLSVSRTCWRCIATEYENIKMLIVSCFTGLWRRELREYLFQNQPNILDLRWNVIKRFFMNVCFW